MSSYNNYGIFSYNTCMNTLNGCVQKGGNKMSIINSFDNKSKPLIDLGAFFEPKNFGDTCIVTFSIHVKEMFLEKYQYEIVGTTKTANGNIDIYRFEVNGKKILFYIIQSFYYL